MNGSEFMAEEFQYLADLKSSEEYQKMKELSAKIDADEELSRLASERDKLYAQADKAEGEERKKLLSAFSKKDEELRSSPLMKEYLSYYLSIKKRLVALQDALTGVLLA